jgi:5-methyltetrahydrofolate--homocysteine methyltransferase
MTERGMDTPLMIGGATTSALHTAVKLAPLYKHVFYGPDASAGAVMAKKCMIGREEFEKEEHRKQEEIRRMYMKKEEEFEKQASDAVSHGFDEDSYLETKPEDMICKEIPIDEVMPYFDWKMFYAVWGVKYGSAVPEAAELMQLRRDAEVELEAGEFNILLSARFFDAVREGNDIVFEVPDKGKVVFPMLRQESGKEMSLCDFIIGAETGRKSPLGMFGISVNAGEKQHVHGCYCPACSNRYEDLIARIVKQTLAEAASKWLDSRLKEWLAGKQVKIVKPAAGYASCPDHTLKKDILEMTGQGLGIKLTESFAMIPEASICGLIFMHPEASYPEIRTISTEQYETYSSRRQMTEDEARRFLGHLIR